MSHPLFLDWIPRSVSLSFLYPSIFSSFVPSFILCFVHCSLLTHLTSTSPLPHSLIILRCALYVLYWVFKIQCTQMSAPSILFSQYFFNLFCIAWRCFEFFEETALLCANIYKSSLWNFHLAIEQVRLIRLIELDWTVLYAIETSIGPRKQKLS